MKIAIYGNTDNKNTLRIVQNYICNKESDSRIILYKPLYDIIYKNGCSFENVTSFSSSEDLIGLADYLFSFGGDGTMLRTISFIKDSGIPVLGFNTGRLGFLSSFPNDAVNEAIEKIKNDDYKIEKRSVLNINSELFEDELYNYALNDFVIQRSNNPSMIKFKVSINDDFLNTYWADGLIVSTTTGSTAYSLSCGGPILVPQSRVFVITPIAPHNLNVRPIVVSSDSEIKIELEEDSGNYVTTLDTTSKDFNKNGIFSITKANHSISLIRFDGHDFFETLRNKLSWGIDKRNV